MSRMIKLIYAIVILMLLCIDRSYAQSDSATEIVSLATEKCLGVADDSLASGADVIQTRCQEGANQKWLAHKSPSPGYVYLVNQNSALCLDVRIGGPQNGTLQQYTCHFGDNQLFRFEPRADGVGGVRIVAKHSGHCLDVPWGSMQDGLLLQQYPCHQGRNQRWLYADSGPYRFQVSATPIGRRTLYLREGHSYTFSLSDISTGAVPYMHLWSHTQGNVTPLTQNLGILRLSTLSYAVPPDEGGTYWLFVHAPPGVASGTATLTIRENGSRFWQYTNFPIGGTSVDVPRSTSSSQFRYETSIFPGGVADTFILALNNLNYLQEFDNDSGTGRASLITGNIGTSTIVVGTVNRTEGTTVLYANDAFHDNDGDGLGYGLERELGTCDLKNAQAHCAAVFDLMDTDRDGIEDGVEVLGLDDGALYFPTWGANPLHKDLFIEADWLDQFERTPLNQWRIRRMQYHLAHGPAAHLDNLDGMDGIAIHVDAGIDPTDPADLTLYGAWGGANRVPLEAWEASGPSPPVDSFDPRRLLYFRHLLLLKAGGQTSIGRFWYATGTDPDTIMHEFGHTVGLQHERVVSGSTWPIIRDQACSPAYPSVMNYATSYMPFHTGDGFPPEGINPSNLCEADGLGSEVSDLSYLTNSFHIPVDNVTGRVDWNRDGTFSGSAPSGGASRCYPWERVRAVINWSYSGCAAHIQGEFALSPEIVPAGRRDGGDLLGGPAMTRVGSHLYVFYVKRNLSGYQSLFYQSALIGPKSSAGCTEGFKAYSNGNTDDCMDFSGPFEIVPAEADGTPILPSHVAVFSDEDTVQVAISDELGQIRNFTLPAAYLQAGHTSQSVSADPALQDSSGQIVTTNSDLSFVVMGLDPAQYGGTGYHLAMYYVDTSGVVRWASKEYGSGQSFVERGAVMGASGTPLITKVGNSPAIASWTALGSVDDLQLYMVLQRQDARFKLYGYDQASDRWNDLTQAVFSQEAVLGPGHNQKIAFWFQPLLDSNGEIIERGNGFFSILFRYGEGLGGVPKVSTPSMWRSENVSQARPPSEYLRFRVFHKFGHDWYGVCGNNYPIGLGGGFAVYSDEAMPALKAALLKWQGDQYLFSVDAQFANELDEGTLSDTLRAEFQGQGRSLSDEASVRVEEAESEWEIIDDISSYLIKYEGQTLNIYEKHVYDLNFLPLADGIFDMAFMPSPDFKVMEGTLCRAMRGTDFCGTPQQTKWGY